MNKVSETNKNWIVGIIAAIGASLCCIIPVLALIAGAGGIASAFSWLAPARPFLIGLAVIVLSFAWYQKLKPRKIQPECECETDDLPAGKTAKPKFIKSKAFLGLVTIFAAVTISFPYYSQIFYPKNEKQIIIVDKSNLQTAEFKISGMYCGACAEHVKHEVNKLSGIIKADASYENANAQIQFDATKTNLTQIENAINSTGYHVIQSTIK